MNGACDAVYNIRWPPQGCVSRWLLTKWRSVPDFTREHKLAESSVKGFLVFHEHDIGIPQFSGTADDRADQHQYHPYTLHGWCAGSQLRASGNSHGLGAGGVLPLAAVSSFRSGRPRLAEPRSLRTVDRARIHAPLLAASLDRSPGRQQGL